MKAVFTIAGEPMGKGRPQFSTYGGRITARTPQRTVAYEKIWSRWSTRLRQGSNSRMMPC